MTNMKSWNRELALQLIEQEGRTKRWLSSYVGINLESLNHYLTGRRNPSRPVVKLIAQALNTEETILLGENQSSSQEETLTG